jgi:isopentenyldiphosphate isomerase
MHNKTPSDEEIVQPNPVGKDDELLDLVDEDDQIIGTINRNEYGHMLKEKLGFIRAADLFIVNSSGQIYTPVRTASKTIAPNGYDYSAGGHVASGDDYTATIIREAKEEIDLDLSEEDLELVIKTVSKKILYIRSVYLLRSDETPTFNSEDFVSAQWLEPSMLLKNIDEGHLAKSNLHETVVLLQEYLLTH